VRSGAPQIPEAQSLACRQIEPTGRPKTAPLLWTSIAAITAPSAAPPSNLKE
jgi:hypothetical protein